MYQAHSGNIGRIGWEFDKETNQGVLRVEFNSGRTYEYFPVPKHLWDEYWSAKSKGSWFHHNIKTNKNISYEEVED